MRRLARYTLNGLTVLSLVLCVAMCVLWAVRIRHPRVGNGWFVLGSRYTLSLSPDQMAILGPPPPPTDPAKRKFAREMAEAMHATGGKLRYNGTTGGMGHGDLDFGKTLGTDKNRRDANENAPIRMLIAALEEERWFLIAHALLTQTPGGYDASNYDWFGFKLSLEQTTGRPGHWTGVLDGVRVELSEDKPRKDQGSWGEEIWAVVTTPQTTPADRARVCRRWHERLDVTLWTVPYSRVAFLALALPAMRVGASVADRLRRHALLRRRRCPSCGYDLRATPERCPECGRAAAH